MKAGVLERIECLSVKDVDDPQLERGSIILRVRACSICSTDLRIFHHGHPRVKLPHILGHEIAGEIIAIGEGVQGYGVRDRVAVTPTVACGECFYCRKGLPVYCQRRRSFGYQLAGGYAELRRSVSGRAPGLLPASSASLRGERRHDGGDHRRGAGRDHARAAGPGCRCRTGNPHRKGRITP